MKTQHHHHNLCLVSSSSSSTLLLLLAMMFTLISSSAALLRFNSHSTSISFVDAPATFAVPLNSSGACGALSIADPLDACSSLRRAPEPSHAASQERSYFALIVRGNCSFDAKVRHAQDAGYRAAIIYDDRQHHSLVSMIGDSRGILVPAVFISNRVGEILKNFARGEKDECCISPFSQGRAWTVLVISIFSLVIIVFVFAMLLFARNRQVLRQHPNDHSPHINRRMVKNLPTVKFNITCRNDIRTTATCAICLEDYRDGDRLRVLPCQHDFHISCVDVWLSKWGTFCPVCKLDMRKVHSSTSVVEIR